jgi:hypothetical protein
MTQVLPALPRNVEYDISEVSNTRGMTPPLGGPTTQIDRPGTRHAIRVSVPAIAAKGCGPALLAQLAQGRTEHTTIAIPEPTVPVLSYGSVVVSGAGQTGRTLNVSGLTPGVTVPAGKWLSFEIGGQTFAYFTRAAVTGAGGVTGLPVYPTIRRSPASGATVALAAPRMGGFVTGALERTVRRIGALGFSFTITERE